MIRKSRKRVLKKVATIMVGRGQLDSARHFSRHYRLQSRQGHGFAAEDLSKVFYELKGHKVKVLHQSSLNGPDLKVDGDGVGVKFCKTAAGTERELFKDKRYRYWNGDRPMPQEVPAEQHAELIKRVKIRIKKGHIPGAKLSDASRIIRKSRFTYKTAVAVSKPGNIPSLAYDAYTGMVYSTTGATIGMILTYVLARAEGKSCSESRKLAAKSAVTIFGTQLTSHVLTHQVARMSWVRVLSKPSLYLATRMTPGLRNALAFAATGAGANTINSIGTVAKVIQGNVISTVATSAVMSVGDIMKYCRNEISGKQLAKNTLVRTGSIAGAGIAAWGTQALVVGLGIINPIFGFFAGLFGAAIGGVVVGKGVKQVLDYIWRDDEEELKEELNRQLAVVCNNFSVSMEEIEKYIFPALRKYDFPSILTNMFQANDRPAYAWSFCMRLVKEAIYFRKLIPQGQS